MDVNDSGLMNYGVGTLGGDRTGGFLNQLQDGNNDMLGMDAVDLDLATKALNRNRGNYRCSKVREALNATNPCKQGSSLCLRCNCLMQCGEPKKGHVCPLVPSNYKCIRCGLAKKSCTCSAPTTRSIGVQVEIDLDMTTRVLDLSVQGMMDFNKTVEGYGSPL